MFDRSKFMKNRWSEASSYYNYYKSQNPNTDLKKRDFFKSENPFFENIKVFEVSFQLSYRDSLDNGIQIDKQTFKVYVLNVNPETETVIYNNTVNSIVEMRGKSTGDSWSKGSKENLIKSELSVDTPKLIEPRGIEEKKEVVSRELINKVIANEGFYMEDLDSSVNVKKIKKGNVTGNYEQNLDLTYFM